MNTEKYTVAFNHNVHLIYENISLAKKTKKKRKRKITGSAEFLLPFDSISICPDEDEMADAYPMSRP